MKNFHFYPQKLVFVESTKVYTINLQFLVMIYIYENV